MIRRVAFRKAVVGGALGALAWEAVVRLLIFAGLPMFDLVKVLGTMLLTDDAPAWQWWPMGMAMHALVGAVWAVFYAYFFWSLMDIRPILQGLLFAVLPTLLAGLIMIPQMDLMLTDPHDPFRAFAIGIGFLGPVSVILGHLIYGAVLGSIYVKPVGYPVGKRIVYG
ncbi:MAG TPA: hypothetical protein VFZ23_08330 [Pyrinomonadaceae bacterium]